MALNVLLTYLSRFFNINHFFHGVKERVDIKKRKLSFEESTYRASSFYQSRNVRTAKGGARFTVRRKRKRNDQSSGGRAIMNR